MVGKGPPVCTYTVGTYSPGKLSVVYDINMHVLPTVPSPTTTHLMGLPVDIWKRRGDTLWLSGNVSQYYVVLGFCYRPMLSANTYGGAAVVVHAFVTYSMTFNLTKEFCCCVALFSFFNLMNTKSWNGNFFVDNI